MAKAWADFYDFVLPEVPGVPTAEADHIIRDAAIDFYDRSGVVVSALSAITIVPGTHTYTLTPASGYDVKRIDELMYGDVRLYPVSNAQLAQMFLNWQTIDGAPQYYLQETLVSFRLVPRPDPDLTFSDTIVPRIVVAPTRSATQITEDWVFNKWAEGIGYGAIARLMRMQQKPWSNPERALLFEGLYRRVLGEARNSADRGKAGAVQMARLKRIF